MPSPLEETITCFPNFRLRSEGLRETLGPSGPLDGDSWG